MLTGTATNAPKSFPKSPDELLKKSQPAKPMTPKQWETMIKYLSGGNRKEKPEKPKRKSQADTKV